MRETIYYDHQAQEPRAVDIALPAGAHAGPGVCLVHGGGWYAGSRARYREVQEWFVARGYPCATVGYRTDNASRMAEKAEDVALGYLTFADVLETRGLSAPVLMGGSAGAHLVTMLTEAGPEPWAPHLTGRWRQPLGCIAVNGPGSLVEWDSARHEIDSLAKLVGAEFTGDLGAFRMITPEQYVVGGLPPILVLLAEQEKIFPHRHVHAWVELLREAGTQVDVHVIDGVEHGFLYGTTSDPQRRALDVVETYLNQLTGSAEAASTSHRSPVRPRHL
ncbi:alpha/beta hydrolase [Streptomyces rubrogriseus]|uniref:alpha/beta hydrolase n=1 Tax=Streptomyces rubrogriseus TaxID=194673 RepID=UPI0036FB891C